VFNYLINENELDPLTQDDIRRLQAAREELDELETIYDNTDNANELTDLSNRISELETEISVFEDKKDIYFLVEYGEHYGLTTFDYEGTRYSVGTDTESEDAAKSAVESLIDDTGIEGFNRGFIENYIDEDAVVEVIREFFSQDVYDSPEFYLDNEDRELSSEQDSEIEKLMEEWRELEKKTEQTDDDDELEEIYDRVDDIRNEIDEIKENPEGDYDEDKIEQMIENRVDEYKDRLEDFFTEYYGVDYMRWVLDNGLININELIDGVVEADGYGVSLNTYDHSYETEEVSGTYYNIFRLD
jgi:peptidoglycan hydrolase CwlO-like protein